MLFVFTRADYVMLTRELASLIDTFDASRDAGEMLMRRCLCYCATIIYFSLRALRCH